ncbi:aldo/keto reductase [Dentipellis sp. KUC8613]|nr:aldo/keto reductase [Dentipellis sp. KUC8613]
MVQKTARLGGSASNVVVGKIGHGLMRMTWFPRNGVPVADEEAFESMKAGMDNLPPGAKMLLNTGEFYGHEPRTANLDLVARFFEKYPQYKEKAFLCVKGGSADDTVFRLDMTDDNVRRCIDLSIDKLRGTIEMHHFELARISPHHPVEDNMKVLSEQVKAGKFHHIGLSETRAETIRRAHKVAPVTSVEIEVSPWNYHQQIQDVVDTCRELDIAILAYSPLGTGLDKKEGHAITDVLNEVAKRNNITLAQACIAWVASRGDHMIPIPGSSHKDRTLENMAAGDIEFSPEDLAKIDAVVAEHNAKGGRPIDDPRMDVA